MSTYRLAFAMVRYFPFGGMQRILLRIAQACAARGHDIHLFVSEWTGTRPPDLPVSVLKAPAITNYGRNDRFGRALRKAVAAGGFDCLVSSNRQPQLDIYYAGDPCWADALRKRRDFWYRYFPVYGVFFVKTGK